MQNGNATPQTRADKGTPAPPPGDNSRAARDAVIAQVLGHLGRSRELPDSREMERFFTEQAARREYGYKKPSETRLVPMAPPVESDGRDRRLQEMLAHRDDTFSQAVLHWIDRKGFTDVEVYKRANIDRKLFCKLRCDVNYRPSKVTALALCLALRLNVDDTVDLLARAGYALSGSLEADIIIKCFIEEGEYDIFALNAALFANHQPCLGA